MGTPLWTASPQGELTVSSQWVFTALDVLHKLIIFRVLSIFEFIKPQTSKNCQTYVIIEKPRCLQHYVKPT